MSAVATPISGEEKNGLVVPSSTEVSRSTDRRYSEVVNEYMKRQNRLGPQNSNTIQPSQVLTHQADEAGLAGASYVSWDHPDTPSSQRAWSAHGSDREEASPQLQRSPWTPPVADEGEEQSPQQQRSPRTPSAGHESEASALQLLNPEVGARTGRGGSASSAGSHRTGNDSYTTAKTHHSPTMETFRSPVSQTSPSPKSVNVSMTSPSSPKMGMRLCNTPPQPPARPPPKGPTDCRTSPGPTPVSERDAPRTSQDMETRASVSSNPFRADLQSPAVEQGGPGGSGRTSRSPAKAPAINVISVGGSPRHLLRESPGEEYTSAPSSSYRDKPLSPTDLSHWLSTGAEPQDGGRGEPPGTTPLVPASSDPQDPYRTHLVPLRRSRDGQQGHESSAQKTVAPGDLGASDQKRYSGETSMHCSPLENRPFNPLALNFENVSARGSDVSQSFREALGSTSYPPDETGATCYKLNTPSLPPSSGGRASLPQAFWTPWGRRPTLLGSKTTYEKSLDKQERLGWCLVVTGVLLIITSAVTILIVEVPAHRNGLLLDEPVSQPLQGLFQNDLTKFILIPSEAPDTTAVPDTQDSTLATRNLISGTEGETLISEPSNSGFEASVPVSEASTPASQGSELVMGGFTSSSEDPAVTESSVSDPEGSFFVEEASIFVTTESSSSDDASLLTTKGSVSDPESSYIQESSNLDQEGSTLEPGRPTSDAKNNPTRELEVMVTPPANSNPGPKNPATASEGAIPGSEVSIITTEASPPGTEASQTPSQSSSGHIGFGEFFQAMVEDMMKGEDAASSPAPTTLVPSTATSGTEPVTPGLVSGDTVGPAPGAQDDDPDASPLVVSEGPTGQGDTPPTASAAPPTDSAAPPKDYVALVTDSAAPPTDSVAPPTDSAAPPKDSAALPKDSVALVSDSAAPLSTDSAAPPTDSAAPPTDSAAPPTDSAAPPKDYVALMSDSAAPLSTDSAAPPTDSAAPLSTDSALPTINSVPPMEAGELPRESAARTASFPPTELSTQPMESDSFALPISSSRLPRDNLAPATHSPEHTTFPPDLTSAGNDDFGDILQVLRNMSIKGIAPQRTAPPDTGSLDQSSPVGGPGLSSLPSAADDEGPGLSSLPSAADDEGPGLSSLPSAADDEGPGLSSLPSAADVEGPGLSSLPSAADVEGPGLSSLPSAADVEGPGLSSLPSAADVEGPGLSSSPYTTEKHIGMMISRPDYLKPKQSLNE